MNFTLFAGHQGKDKKTRLSGHKIRGEAITRSLILPGLVLFLGTAGSTFATTLTDFGTLQWTNEHAGASFDPSSWTRTFNDTFPYDPTLSEFAENSATSGTWYVPGHSSYGVGTFQVPGSLEYANTFISQPGGGLDLRAHRTSATSTTWYTAGMASVNGSGVGFAQRYGYFELTGQLPLASGSATKFCAWPAFWLLSQNGFDPNRTVNRVEMDMLEWYSNDFAGIHSTVHLIDPSNVRQSVGAYVSYQNKTNLSAAAHTFGIKITPAWVCIYIDRVEITRFPTVEEFSTPMYMLVNNAMTSPNGSLPDLGETAWNFNVSNVSVYAMPTEIVLDNSAATGVVQSGAWNMVTTTAGYYGTNYLDDAGTGKGSKSVTYTPTLPCEGTYEVYTWWPASSGNATNVSYSVTSADGTNVVTRDQTKQGGQWVYLGTHYFYEGSQGSVTVSNTGTTAGKHVISDAVRFSLIDPWQGVNQDIGSVGVAGTSSLNGGAYTIQASGADIWNTADSFHFIGQPVTGDVTMVARVASLVRTNSWAKAGLMIRESLSPQAPNAFALVPAAASASLQVRPTAAALTTSEAAAGHPPDWVKLTRVGNIFTAYQSPNGSTWTQLGTPQTISMSGTAEIGLAVTSHDNANLTTAVLDNLDITIPPPPALTGQDIGSVGVAGSDSLSNGVYTINASGSDIWGTADAFRLLSTQVTGDVAIVARVSGVTHTNDWAKAGIMIRESLSPQSSCAFALIPSDASASFQVRATTAGATTSQMAAGAPPYWVKLTRVGNVFTAYRSPDGVVWSPLGAPQTITMATTVYVGLAVSSHNNTTLATATLDNLSIGTP